MERFMDLTEESGVFQRDRERAQDR
jgi:hypothetical protein